jgi:hypothetical protein
VNGLKTFNEWGESSSEQNFSDSNDSTSETESIKSGSNSNTNLDVNR